MGEPAHLVAPRENAVITHAFVICGENSPLALHCVLAESRQRPGDTAPWDSGGSGLGCVTAEGSDPPGHRFGVTLPIWSVHVWFVERKHRARAAGLDVGKSQIRPSAVAPRNWVRVCNDLNPTCARQTSHRRRDLALSKLKRIRLNGDEAAKH